MECFQRALALKSDRNSSRLIEWFKLYEWEIYKNLAECAKKQTKPNLEIALNHIQKANQLSSSNVVVLCERADIFRLLKKYNEANSDIDAAFKLKKGKEDRLYFLRGKEKMIERNGRKGEKLK